MKKKKVLHIITRLDRGGSSENTLLTILNLDRKKYECALLYGLTKDPDRKYFSTAESKTEMFICFEGLVREINLYRDVKSFFKILFFIRKGHFNIVHTHSSKAGILGRWAAWIAGVPAIIHTPHGHVFYGYYGRVISGIFVFIERVTALVTDRIISLTERGKKEHIAFGVGNEQKLLVVHSGVDVDFIRDFEPTGKGYYRKKLKIPDDALVMGSMGRFTKIKGYEYFISAAEILMSKNDRVYFILAGEGELEKKFREMVSSKGLDDRFFFLPWQEDARSFLYSLDLFILTSLNEGMGKVVVEAMSAGLPVVGSDVGGVSEIIEDGRNGFVVTPGDEQALAEKINTLCSDKELLLQMGDEGRKRSDSFSVKSMVEKIDKLYEELLKEKGL